MAATETIFGRSWAEISNMQQKKSLSDLSDDQLVALLYAMEDRNASDFELVRIREEISYVRGIIL